MFKSLSVKNFAIIEDANISFKDGLTVLTGETGAGKSLIIDSIDLLLGERASTELIRNGEDKASIVGTFTFSNKRLGALLNKLDIEYSDNVLEISRTISTKNNVVKVNNKTVTLQDLKSIAKYLADIHEQFDMIKLLNKENYFEMVDGFKYELIEEYKNKYLLSLEETKKEREKYLSLEKRVNEIKDKRETYEYELKELKALNFTLGEEENITEEINLLKNYDKIYDLLKASEEIINKDSLLDIYTLRTNLKKLSEYQDSYTEDFNKINDYYYELESIYEDIKHKFKHLDYDPRRLEELETRRQEINLAKKKYNKSLEEIIQYVGELEEILKNNEDLDIYLKEARQSYQNKYNETYERALELSSIRKEAAKILEKDLVNNLKDLGLKSSFEVRFVVSSKKDDLSLDIFTINGIDDIDFYIETNIGEGLKPLAKIASGGEISRIMLAIKALYIKSQKIETVIFDEIDTGISGEIASKVANKIKELSLSSQIIIITHLPQVASLSNNHIKISKEVKSGRTYTSIKELSLEEKIYEIALMISDGKVTKAQLEYAKEMIINDNK